MILPDKPTEDIIKYYLDSQLFWTSDWNNCKSCSMWYEFQKIVQHLKIDSVVNVGIGPAQQGKMWNSLLKNIFNVDTFTNIDFDNRFVDNAKASPNTLINNAVLCDVREIDGPFGINTFDLSFWSHGPEHIVREEWKKTFTKLEKITGKIVILQCPWGSGYDYDQEHLAKSIEPKEFEDYGYKTLHCGVKGSKDTNILAWKLL